MARTPIPLNVLTANSGIVAPTPTAIDQANGMSITFPPTTAIPVSPDSTTCFLIVSNTSGSAKNVIIRANTQTWPAMHGWPDLQLSVGAGVTKWAGPFDNGRYTQDDTMSIDFDSGTTGTIAAGVLPRTV